MCWETFESRRRIFGGIDEMFKFCKDSLGHRICYDFSHIHKEQEKILKDLKENICIIKIFHLSNRIRDSIKQHYPVYYSEEKIALDFDKIFTPVPFTIIAGWIKIKKFFLENSLPTVDIESDILLYPLIN